MLLWTATLNRSLLSSLPAPIFSFRIWCASLHHLSMHELVVFYCPHNTTCDEEAPNLVLKHHLPSISFICYHLHSLFILLKPCNNKSLTKISNSSAASKKLLSSWFLLYIAHEVEQNVVTCNPLSNFLHALERLDAFSFGRLIRLHKVTRCSHRCGHRYKRSFQGFNYFSLNFCFHCMFYYILPYFMFSYALLQSFFEYVWVPMLVMRKQLCCQCLKNSHHLPNGCFFCWPYASHSFILVLAFLQQNPPCSCQASITVVNIMFQIAHVRKHTTRLHF